MRFRDWQTRVSELNKQVDAAEAKYRAARERRDKFLMNTVGITPGSIATVEGTAKMVAAVIDMKKVK